ncbi:hypothetical protein DPMN_084649 [Dreissena polymorpha]|uniref:Uncharacterized protein n=1 Tax=Dreissena polymorpha TaxID=45954 RepID=A0A9D3YBD2_DREPO|nr:hypothetical protein DPMN_084649 [Dreissena polymorpha]
MTMFFEEDQLYKVEQVEICVCILSRSEASRFMRTSVESLCCGLVKSCIALLYSDVTGAERAQRFCISSLYSN